MAIRAILSRYILLVIFLRAIERAIFRGTISLEGDSFELIFLCWRAQIVFFLGENFLSCDLCRAWRRHEQAQRSCEDEREA